MSSSENGQPERILPLPIARIQKIAKEEAYRTILQHWSLCSVAELDLEKRTSFLEKRYKIICGIVIGSGILGFITGVALTIFMRG